MFGKLFGNLKPQKSAVAISAAALLLLSESETSKFFWGFGSKKKASDDKTVTYIWGNGHYQSKPGKSIQFGNFTPKKITTFNGSSEKNPYMK
jgi:hypothetical protein